MADFYAWHDATLAEHISLRDTYYNQGYRFLTLSVYASTSSPYYAAVMIRRAVTVTQHDWPSVPGDQWQATFDSEAAQGYGPVIIAATGPASSPLFAAVFEPQQPIHLTRNGLTSGSSTDTSTIQGMNVQAKSQGLIPRWVASYGDAANPAFAAVWSADQALTMWSNDGIGDTSDGYQARFDAETSAWCRPRLVAVNTDAQYLSLFVDSQINGTWQARHNMTSADYQTEFDTLTQQGYFPICVQAGGPDLNSATFAAIFVTSEDTLAKSFTATGPVANAAIDAVIQPLMQTYGVRHASLAIVHAARLVYARAYTLAEPNWPIAQPTTCFRMASVSKTPTALAIYQLIEVGALHLRDTLQSILALSTPSGGPPVDSRFNLVTIEQLLEHTSGLQDNYSDGVAVRDAFIAAGQSATLPVSAEMTDSYVASLTLVSDPGSTQAYNNCGYYLLGRVVAKLRNQYRPIDAYQQYLFNPLSITRIRRGVSLLADQPADEARYQSHDLLVFPSQMSDAQPLVPDWYGTVQAEILEGSGGLSGAATDIARLIAILILKKDSPALKRSTLVSMLKAGAKLTAAGQGRSGYGFDLLTDYGHGQFKGQKGGLIGSSSNALQFDGEWGFAIQWANNQPGALPNQPWYPDFPAVMNIAKKVNWGSGDLFPQFGMPSL
jgi:CubicO group peptidase (beta-lactamase class C family)